VKRHHNITLGEVTLQKPEHTYTVLIITIETSHIQWMVFYVLFQLSSK